MSEKEQIEIANIIKNCFIEESRKESNKMYKWQELPVFDSVISSLAEALSNAGYHKTTWHKVADGDIPKHIGDIIMAIKLDDHIITTTGRYRLYDFYISDIGRIEKDKVIAWTELPQYKE